MNNLEELKRFIYSATVTSGSGSQSFYIDAKNREEADKRAANNESDGMYADDSEVTDLDALEYEDETTVDDFGDFPLISREQSLIAQLEAAQKERDALREVHIGAGSNTRAAADIYFQLVEELEVPAGGSLVGVIENLKAELSAANEKLSKPVALPRMHVGFDGVSTNAGDSVRNKAISDCAEAIRVAGFTVDEGQGLWLT
ncbi:TPA: hypothetical protein PXO11_000820 [Yersinia enterocolitica]|nr:hypothetical protein [Yersinia phage YeP1]QCW23440.1 hypothetical protein [Yersinia phage YeP2]QCW23503.1 hypothetical protein [Yersinia phage YeP3]HDL6852851.1 hypothetical protein [Yersinia enterocolitica]HDS3336251.1 hypothetical protein [Yersinia enterocolitica subsp. palearctica]